MNNTFRALDFLPIQPRRRRRTYLATPSVHLWTAIMAGTRPDSEIIQAARAL
jgi:hypothetical protein